MTSQRSLNFKTLIVDLSERFGGASTRVISLMRKFPKGQIALAALAGSPVAVGAQSAGCTVHIVGRRKTDPVILPRLLGVIREGGYRVLDTQNVQSKFWGSLAALGMDIPLVSTLNSWYASEHASKGLKGRLYTNLEFLTNRNLARYIVVSRQIYSALVEGKVDPSRIDLIYNGVALNPESVPDVRVELLEQYGLPHDAQVFLAAGRLVWAKGYQYLVAAFEQVREENLYCFIVGDGELREPLERQISNAGLEKRVFLLGYAEHARTLSLIKASDVFVMSSLNEGTPIALLEAAALARPILATHVGGIGELVEDGKEALLVEPNDPDALHQAILRLARDPQLAARLGRQAQERVAREFNISSQVQATIESYRNALAGWRTVPQTK